MEKMIRIIMSHKGQDSKRHEAIAECPLEHENWYRTQAFMRCSVCLMNDRFTVDKVEFINSSYRYSFYSF